MSDAKQTCIWGVAQCARFAYSTSSQADMAQLVEHNLAKVGVAGSSPVVRSIVCKEPVDQSALFISAAWPSGKAEACKAFTPGSNPGAASITLRKGRPAGCPFCYSSAFTAPASFAISTPLQPTMPIPMERSEAHCDPSWGYRTKSVSDIGPSAQAGGLFPWV